MLIQDKIYPLMPIGIQNLMISGFGYKWHLRRFGGIFQSELDKVRKREIYSYEQWNAFQTLELRRLLIHAYTNVPFYQKKYSEAGFSLLDFERFELYDLQKLPVLTKSELRQFGTTSLLSNKREKKGVFYGSSGSTGTPTQILYSEAFHQRWSAIFEARIRNWAGISRENSRGMIGGRRVVPAGKAKPPYYRYNFIEKQVYFSAYHISASNAIGYAEAFEKYQIEYMTGYAMSNYFLARFFDENNIRVPNLKAVITSSEKLTPAMRNLFTKIYGCKTYDSYSGVEACGLISENEFGQLLVNPDVGVMEILRDDGKECQPGEIGEVFSTGFLNYDQPLIRYQIGDLVHIAHDQTTKCGRNMPIIQEIIGRLEDTVIGLDGREMVRFHGIFVGLPSIIEGQIIQHSLELFEIKVVCVKKLPDDERKKIRERMISQLGEIRLIINEVEHIPRNKNGKFTSVISKVKR